MAKKKRLKHEALICGKTADFTVDCVQKGVFVDVYGDSYPVWSCGTLEVVSIQKPSTLEEAELFAKKFQKKLISQIIGVKCLAGMNREKFASLLGVKEEDLEAVEHGEKVPDQQFVDKVRRIYKRFSTF